MKSWHTSRNKELLMLPICWSERLSTTGGELRSIRGLGNSTHTGTFLNHLSREVLSSEYHKLEGGQIFATEVRKHDDRVMCQGLRNSPCFHPF